MCSQYDTEFQTVKFTPKFERQFKNKNGKHRRRKVLLEEAVTNIQKGLYPHKEKKLTGVPNLKEYVINKDGGIRVYFTRSGKNIIILLYGSKKTQDKDIKWAKEFCSSIHNQ